MASRRFSRLSPSKDLGGWAVAAVATTLTLACGGSTGREASAPPAPPSSAPRSADTMGQRYDDDVPLRPASAPLAARAAPPSAFETAPLGGAPPDPQPACSMHAESAPQGIVLVFGAGTTPAERVLSQVEALAREIDSQRHETPSETAHPDQARPESLSTRQIARFSASSRAEPTDTGARLTLVAKDAEQAQALRARVLWQMASFLPDSRDGQGLCPIVPRLAAEERSP